MLEFRAYFLAGDFGVRLRERLTTLASRPSQCLPLPDFSSTVLFTSPDQLKIDETDYMARWGLAGLWGPVEVYSAAQRVLWFQEFGWLTITGLVKRWLDPNHTMVEKLVSFRLLWDQVLGDIWTWVHKIDRPESPGKAAAKLGLGHLYQPNAPPFSRAPAAAPSSNDDSATTSTSPSATDGQGNVYVEAFPIATPGESVARSARAYLSEIGGQLGTKEKVKTRKATVASDVQMEKEAPEAEEEDEDKSWTDLPDVLPSEFSLGRKPMKVRPLNFPFPSYTPMKTIAPI